MFKKFVSKAILSVVMDKSARDNLKIRKKGKQARKAAAPPIPSEAPPSTAPSPPAAEPEPDPLASMSHEETRQLIVDSLKAAEEELGRKPDMTSERKALIDEALAVHHSKAHILDDISEEQRQKLYVLALKSLKTDPGSIVASDRNSKKKPNK